MARKIEIIQMANIVANESELLHCTIEEAGDSINKNITEQFNFEEVKSLIIKFAS